MSLTKTGAAVREVRAAMEAPADETLLQEIAQRRSQAAFALLFSRHGKAAYNLASYLTHDRTEAEEAVQEAMLDIWLSAGSFQGGNARGWLMRIVANKSIDRSKKRKLARERESGEKESSEPGAQMPLPLETAEHSELLAALRQMLESLSPGDRQLVALYYSAGLSYEEVASELSMPAQTVAFRMKKVLASLKTRLSGAGFAAALPLLNPQGLLDALSSGAAVPEGLAEKVLSKAAAAAGQAARTLSRRAVVAKSSGTAAFVGGAVLLTAGAGAALVLTPPGSSPRDEAPVAVPAQAPEREKPVEPKAAPAPAEVHGRWSFEQGPRQDLLLMNGSWNWKRLDALTAGMQAPSEDDAIVRLPLQIPAVPCLVAARSRYDVMNKFARQGAAWIEGNVILPNRAWYKRAMRTTPFPPEQRMRTYLVDKYGIDVVDEEIVAIREYRQAYPSRNICVYFKNRYVFEIEVHTTSIQAIPEHLRHPEKLLKDTNLSTWLLSDTLGEEKSR